MALTLIGQYTLVQDRGEAEYRTLEPGRNYKIVTGITGGVATITEITPTVPMRVSRMIRTRTWEAPVTDGSTAPDTPVNPGNLSTDPITYTLAGVSVTYWPNSNDGMDCSRRYGRPLSKTYRETWITKAPIWQFE